MIGFKKRPRDNENLPLEDDTQVETDYVKGVPKGAKTAAEMYQVLGSFKRFNQKYNMTRQRFWDPDAAAERREGDPLA